jgi:hypothetical protein
MIDWLVLIGLLFFLIGLFLRSIYYRENADISFMDREVNLKAALWVLAYFVGIVSLSIGFVLRS